MTRASIVSRRRLLQQAAGAAAWLAAGKARASPDVRAWPAGRTAPVLLLNDLGGKAWSLAALRGRPVLLNFWASWCEPCRNEMPALDLMALRYESAGLVALTVNFKDGLTAIQRFLDAVPLTLPVLPDRDGAVAKAWGVTLFPTTLLIDRRGLPRTVVRGEVDWTGAEGRALVEPLLAG